MKLLLCVLFISFSFVSFAQQIDTVRIKTFAKENPTTTFRCRVPAKYDKSSVAKYRLLIYFGGRNTTGENEVKSKSWGNWCNKNGSIVSYIDQDGLEKSYERDEFGRITKEIFPDSTEVGYEYDAVGKLSKVIDQNGHEIKFAWNKYGLDYRKTAVGQITQNVYDQYGRLSQVDSKFENGSVDRSFSYQYDELDRLSNIAYGPTENEKLKYDTWGKLVEKIKERLGLQV